MGAHGRPLTHPHVTVTRVPWLRRNRDRRRWALPPTPPLTSSAYSDGRWRCGTQRRSRIISGVGFPRGLIGGPTKTDGRDDETARGPSQLPYQMIANPAAVPGEADSCHSFRSRRSTLSSADSPPSDVTPYTKQRRNVDCIKQMNLDPLIVINAGELQVLCKLWFWSEMELGLRLGDASEKRGGGLGLMLGMRLVVGRGGRDEDKERRVEEEEEEETEEGRGLAEAPLQLSLLPLLPVPLQQPSSRQLRLPWTTETSKNPDES
ncbi:hypothetical protein B296_00005429 [Ensete ventricosum]|uniref:Uncharacterized protein n=1 Tax=Ensete ventricosum TaxID=4639 RepID=A0A427A7Y5_ENSVE|nr:hypothetical protein B296_00005429 [Ensete ventricosum]